MSSKLNPDESSSSDDEPAGKQEELGIYVTELGLSDVLLGRGTGPSMNEGNIRFRQIVEDLKPSYVSTTSRKEKKSIVRKAVNGIKASKGRFLTRLRKGEIKMLGMKEKIVYKVVHDSIAIEKTKQAIRYVHYKKDPSQVKKTPPSEKTAGRKRSLQTESTTLDPQGPSMSSAMDKKVPDSPNQTTGLALRMLSTVDKSHKRAAIDQSEMGRRNTLVTPRMTNLGGNSPVQRNNALEEIILKHQLTSLLSNAAPNSVQNQWPQIQGLQAMSTMPQALQQSISRTFSEHLLRGTSMQAAMQGAASAAPGNQNNMLLPLFAGNNTTGQETATGAATPAASHSRASQEMPRGSNAQEAQLRALVQADSERRRLLQSYLSTLPKTNHK